MKTLLIFTLLFSTVVFFSTVHAKTLVAEYWDNGQLMSKGNYKNFQREGIWEFYNRDGQKRFTKNIADGMEAPVILDEGSGTYKNGKKISN
jgi:antitoxin component YwqK of YwqJK toxin-antitoxin module